MANPNQQFQQVIMPNPPRSRQDLSHTFKFTCDFGALIPNLLLEVVPGDAFKCRTDIFMRMQPMTFPVMHEIDVYQHYFYVPWYMIWNKFEQFLIPQENEGSGEGETPIPLPPYFIPTEKVNSVRVSASSTLDLTSDFTKNSLWDYLGLRPISANTDFPQNTTAATSDIRIQLAPFIAYQLIFNEYYRDQNLEPKLDLDYWKDWNGASFIKTQTGVDNYNENSHLSDLFTLRYRAWEKDIFTSALPFPQKNVEGRINLELASDAATVTLNQAALDGNTFPKILNNLGQPITGNKMLMHDGTTTGAVGSLAVNTTGNTAAIGQDAVFDPNGTLAATLSGATSYFTIEELRFAYRMQEFGEMLARGGSRLTEVIRSQFGVTPDDLTMSRPKYLGGGKQNIVISEVLQQSQTNESSALGEFAGHGLSVGSDNRFKAFFSHYGFVIGIMSVRPRTAYGQGVQRLFTKFDRYDYAWPHLSHLGEQPVKNGELYFDYKDGLNDEEFGYQPIYHDYRYIPSRLAGEMRDTLVDFHLNRMFASRPSLNADFIKISPTDTNHIFAVTEGAEGQHLICECFHSIKAVRPLPKYGNPTL